MKLYSQLRDLYGANQFQMASPQFIDLYFAQLTSPFTVFQVSSFTTSFQLSLMYLICLIDRFSARYYGCWMSTGSILYSICS